MAVVAGVGSRVGVSVNAGVAVKVGDGNGVGEYAATVCVIIWDASSTDLVATTSTVGVGTVLGAQADTKTILRRKILELKKRRFMFLPHSIFVGRP